MAPDYTAKKVRSFSILLSPGVAQGRRLAEEGEQGAPHRELGPVEYVQQQGGFAYDPSVCARKMDNATFRLLRDRL